MTALVVREMTGADVPAVVEIDGEFASVSTVEYQGIGEGAEEWLRSVPDSQQWEAFVAESDGRVVGFGVTVDLGMDDCDFCFEGVEDTLYLVYMAVRSTHRGRGIGSRLLDHAHAIAARRNRTRLLVDVAADSPHLTWYARRDFQEIGAQKYMVKRLG